ncbi:MAG: GDSL-type esterase/lipase family protein, partial [Bacteroidota bacterium]
MMLTKFQIESISKFIQFLFIAVMIPCTLISCDEDDTQPKPRSTSLNKIMPLGASRVEGARPAFESFRYELWKLLVDGEWDFDYIGTQTDNASYEDFLDLPFDSDHEGRGGWTSGEILDGISEWINKAGAPDIVLFSSPGGNDILNGLSSYNETISNINAIIDILQTANPNVTIIIEQLAPGKSSFMTAAFTTTFNNMQQEVVTIATQQTTVTSQVITVDMFTGFNDSHLADDVHYNDAGAKFIADRYYNILQDVL